MFFLKTGPDTLMTGSHSNRHTRRASSRSIADFYQINSKSLAYLFPQLSRFCLQKTNFRKTKDLFKLTNI